MVDVGIPIYGQLQKVKGSFNENSEISADKPQQPGVKDLFIVKRTL